MYIYTTWHTCLDLHHRPVCITRELYIHICIYIHICTYIYICIFIHIYVYIYAYVYICIRIYTHACMYLFITRVLQMRFICLKRFLSIGLFYRSLFIYFTPDICVTSSSQFVDLHIYLYEQKPAKEITKSFSFTGLFSYISLLTSVSRRQVSSWIYLFVCMNRNLQKR